MNSRIGFLKHHRHLWLQLSFLLLSLLPQIGHAQLAHNTGDIPLMARGTMNKLIEYIEHQPDTLDLVRSVYWLCGDENTYTIKAGDTCESPGAKNDSLRLKLLKPEEKQTQMSSGYIYGSLVLEKTLVGDMLVPTAEQLALNQLFRTSSMRALLGETLAYGRIGAGYASVGSSYGLLLVGGVMLLTQSLPVIYKAFLTGQALSPEEKLILLICATPLARMHGDTWQWVQSGAAPEAAAEYWNHQMAGFRSDYAAFRQENPSLAPALDGMIQACQSLTAATTNATQSIVQETNQAINQCIGEPLQKIKNKLGDWAKDIKNWLNSLGSQEPNEEPIDPSVVQMLKHLRQDMLIRKYNTVYRGKTRGREVAPFVITARTAIVHHPGETIQVNGTPYLILEILGHGDSGIIYKVEHNHSFYSLKQYWPGELELGTMQMDIQLFEAMAEENKFSLAYNPQLPMDEEQGLLVLQYHELLTANDLQQYPFTDPLYFSLNLNTFMEKKLAEPTAIEATDIVGRRNVGLDLNTLDWIIFDPQ